MLNKLLYTYNLMEKIETKGQSTIYMGECLKALREIIAVLDTAKEERKEEEGNE